jgi:hypothetical protein
MIVSLYFIIVIIEEEEEEEAQHSHSHSKGHSLQYSQLMRSIDPSIKSKLEVSSSL